MPTCAVFEYLAWEYLAWARSTCGGNFFSCNQESAREVLGDEQGVVARPVECTGGFSRLRHDRSWVRAGYVEEMYAPADPEARSRVAKGQTLRMIAVPTS